MFHRGLLGYGQDGTLRGELAEDSDLARLSEDPDDGCLLALALVYDGGSRSEEGRACRIGLQTFRDWVLRFSATGPAGLVDGKGPGAASARFDTER